MRHVKTGALLPVFVPVPTGSIVPMKTRATNPPEGCVQLGYELAMEFESELHVQPYSTEPYSPPSTKTGVLSPIIMQAETKPWNATQQHVRARHAQGQRPRHAKMERTSSPIQTSTKQLSPLNPRRMYPGASDDNAKSDDTAHPTGMRQHMYHASIGGEPLDICAVQDSFTSKVIFAP